MASLPVTTSAWLKVEKVEKRISELSWRLLGRQPKLPSPTTHIFIALSGEMKNYLKMFKKRERESQCED